MRPFLRPRAVGPSTAPEDLALMETCLRQAADDVLAVREHEIRGGGVIELRGALRVPAATALSHLVERFRPFGYTPFIRGSRADVVLQAWPLRQVVAPSRVAVNVVLAVATLLTTLVAGACGGLCLASPVDVAVALAHKPVLLLEGVPFALTLLAILATHEFGHYFTARRHGAVVSLPYFIPVPPPLLFGTLGAIIRMKSPVRDRNALFDIAAAGPLAGLVVAVPALVLGLGWSTVGPVPPGLTVRFGEPLLMQWLVALRFGAIPHGSDVFAHPVAIAGWVGLLVTALNLCPIGQLDGGRIAYALFGRHHRAVGIASFVGLLLLGLVTGAANWFVWAALLFFLIGFHHTPPLDDVTPLSPGRRAVGLGCLVLLVLLVPPVPLDVG